MMEEAQQQPSNSQSVSGNYNPVVQGTGNATVNINMPTLGRQWLKPARLSLGNKSFVGRQQLVNTLIKQISTRNAVAITGKQIVKAFQGMGGIGKTYLALKLGIELYDRFPGGVIRIDVGPQVIDEASAQVPLGRLASYAFGGFTPLGAFQPEQVASWLAQTAPGPFLVIFDDLWDPKPLRFLSRALPSVAVQLVTTRFTNVASAIGATIIPLDRLSPEDGLALLEERLQCQDIPAHRPTLEALVRLLGGHALALELAAAQIRKPTRLSTVLAELEQGIGRGNLSGLNITPGDGRDDNLERSFALSYERMTPIQQRLFRALGVFAEESIISEDAAATVWSIENLNTARKVLYELADIALLNEIEDGTAATVFRQHSLLRLYARALMKQTNELANYSELHVQFYVERCWQATGSAPVDYEFLDQHLPNILTALHYSEHNNLVLFPSLLNAIEEFLLLRGQLALLEIYLPKAITIAKCNGDSLQAANLLMSLGTLESRLGNLDQARIHYEAAQAFYHSVQNYLGEAHIYMNLGLLEKRLGSLDQARIRYEAALSLYRAIPDQQGEANVHMSLGDLEIRLDDADQAGNHYHAALSFYKTLNDRQGEANLLMRLGDLENWLGHPDQVRDRYDAALSLYRAIQDCLGEANLLMRLGDLDKQLGNHHRALDHYNVALSLYRKERSRQGEANLLMRLGDLDEQISNPDQARDHYDAALSLYNTLQDHLGEAHVRRRLGNLEHQLGHLDQAQDHYEIALSLYRREHYRQGEAETYKSLGDMFLAQERWEEAKTYYEKALPLFTFERESIEQGRTLLGLGRARFELGDHQQGMKDVQRAAELHRCIQDKYRANKAEQRLNKMRARLEKPL